MVRGFVMLANFRSVAQLEIRAQRFHLIPVARILRAVCFACLGLFQVRVRCWQGIHFRPRRHQRGKWRETNCVGNRRIVLLLRCLRFGRLRFGRLGLRRKMRMRFPL